MHYQYNRTVIRVEVIFAAGERFYRANVSDKGDLAELCDYLDSRQQEYIKNTLLIHY